MSDLSIRTVGMYVLGLIIIGACFWLIANKPGAHVQEWATITGIIGYLIRDAGGASGTRAAERITSAAAQNQPTVTTTTGPPPTTTVRNDQEPN